MDFFSGIKYNIRGFFLAVKTPSLLVLGLLRFVIILILALLSSGAVLYWQDTILGMIWKMPETGWLVYVWHVTAWLLSLVLAGVAVLFSYLVAQLFFCVFIMDYMSRLTEKIVTGKEGDTPEGSWLAFFGYLIRQEIPRAVIPLVITLVIMVLGLFTPLSLAIIVISSVTAGMFLAWDNTDLIPARQMIPFRQRIGFLRRNLLFHIGFGILFLVPWLNILLLSFAPVGATLYHIDKRR